MSKPTPPDEYETALREVDAITPGSPPVARAETADRVASDERPDLRGYLMGRLEWVFVVWLAVFSGVSAFRLYEFSAVQRDALEDLRSDLERMRRDAARREVDADARNAKLNETGARIRELERRAETTERRRR